MFAPTNMINNYVNYFSLMKGSSDIRSVFNGTSCGINDTTWSSNIISHDPVIIFGYKAVYIDLGFFLNFLLHESLQALIGVDLSSS